MSTHRPAGKTVGPRRDGDMGDDPRSVAPIAHAVREARKARAWNQSELAMRAGVSRPTVARLETGRSVSSTTLEKVAEALELHLVLHK